LLDGITKRHMERKELVHNIPNYTFGNAGEVRKRFSLLTLNEKKSVDGEIAKDKKNSTSVTTMEMSPKKNGLPHIKKS